jgi:hypothetical protein
VLCELARKHGAACVTAVVSPPQALVSVTPPYCAGWADIFWTSTRVAINPGIRDRFSMHFSERGVEGFISTMTAANLHYVAYEKVSATNLCLSKWGSDVLALHLLEMYCNFASVQCHYTQMENQDETRINGVDLLARHGI